MNCSVVRVGVVGAGGGAVGERVLGGHFWVEMGRCFISNVMNCDPRSLV